MDANLTAWLSRLGGLRRSLAASAAAGTALQPSWARPPASRRGLRDLWQPVALLAAWVSLLALALVGAGSALMMLLAAALIVAVLQGVFGIELSLLG